MGVSRGAALRESRSPVEGSLRLSVSGPGPIPGRLPFRLNWVTAFLGVLLTSVSTVDGELVCSGDLEGVPR